MLSQRNEGDKQKSDSGKKPYKICLKKSNVERKRWNILIHLYVCGLSKAFNLGNVPLMLSGGWQSMSWVEPGNHWLNIGLQNMKPGQNIFPWMSQKSSVLMPYLVKTLLFENFKRVKKKKKVTVVIEIRQSVETLEEICRRRDEVKEKSNILVCNTPWEMYISCGWRSWQLTEWLVESCCWRCTRPMCWCCCCSGPCIDKYIAIRTQESTQVHILCPWTSGF